LHGSRRPRALPRQQRWGMIPKATDTFPLLSAPIGCCMIMLERLS